MTRHLKNNRGNYQRLLLDIVAILIFLHNFDYSIVEKENNN
jgi:hypothetical protein